jgi:hypothetical protein
MLTPFGWAAFAIGKWHLTPAEDMKMLLALGGTWVLFQYIIWNTTPPALGEWVAAEGPQEGATFDFHRGGTMVGVVNVGGDPDRAPTTLAFAA